MKWYSVRKYIPTACDYLFIRAVTKGDRYYNRYFVAMIEDFSNLESLESWEMANCQELIDIDPCHYKVTHFAIPDPIEIEE